MADKNIGIGKAILHGVTRAAAFQFTLTYIVPLTVPLVTATLIYSEGLPLSWIWLGALAAFAFIATGLLRFDEWRQRRRVEGKIAFEQALIGRNIHDEKGILIGLRVSSSATFPLEFDVVKLTTRIGDRVPAKQTRDGTTRIEIPPNGSGWFYDNPIQIQDPPTPGTLEGFMEFHLRYGRPGQLKYDLKGGKQVIAAFNEQGLFSHGSWNAAS